MNIETTRNVLLWCAIINYGILLLWFLLFRYAHDRVYRLHTRWFRLSPGQFDAIHYSAMSIYKVGILLLNFIPYLAMRIVT